METSDRGDGRWYNVSIRYERVCLRRMCSLADHVATAVIERFDRLKPRGKPQGREWTVLAGIVVEDITVS